MARYPIMLLTIVLLTVAIAVTYFVKTRTGDKGLDEQPQVENRWDEWGDPNDPNSPQDPNMEPVPEVPGAVPQSFDQALQISQQTGKPVMLFFTSSRSTDWVPKMRETLADPKVAALMSNYVFYEVDCDREQPRYRLSGWPTIAITDSNGVIKRYMVGYKGALAFRVWLKNGRVERNEVPVPQDYQMPPQMPQEQNNYQIQPEYPQPEAEPERRWGSRIFNRGG